MNDRVVILFATGGEDVAAVRKRWGARDVHTDLAAFFAAEDADPMHDNRYHDPEYLAARYVAWTATPLGKGVGVVGLAEREDMTVRVHCDNHGHPLVEDIRPTPAAPAAVCKCFDGDRCGHNGSGHGEVEMVPTVSDEVLRAAAEAITEARRAGIAGDYELAGVMLAAAVPAIANRTRIKLGEVGRIAARIEPMLPGLAAELAHAVGYPVAPPDTDPHSGD